MNNQALTINSLINEPERGGASIKFVTLPEHLIRYKNAIGVGLYAYTLEKYEITSMDSNSTKKKARIDLSSKAAKILNEAVTASDSNNNPHLIQDVFYSALLWLSKQPLHILKTKI